MYVRMCLCGYAGWCVGVYTPDRNDLKLRAAYTDFGFKRSVSGHYPPDATPRPLGQ